VVLQAFQVASEHLTKEKLAAGSNFEVALVLNTYTKVQLATALPVAAALHELEARCARQGAKPLDLVAVSLVLGALARLALMPPPGLEQALLGPLLRGPPGSRALQDSLDIVRTVGMLNALVRLDAAAHGCQLRPWLEVLLQRLVTVLEQPEAGLSPALGVQRRFGDASEQGARAAGAWSSHTLPTALDAVCMLSGVGGRLWWRCSERLVERAAEMMTSRPAAPRAADEFAESRQAWQAMLMLFHFRLLPQPRAVRPSLRLLRAVRAVSASAEARLRGGSDPHRGGEAAAEHGDSLDELQAVACAVQAASQGLGVVAHPSLKAQVLHLYSIDLLLPPATATRITKTRRLQM
ncbi:unnamed protein product, partial [Polarella glacialis]